MKYTICGFSQEAALKFKQVITENGKTKTLKLDNTDLTLLRWFVDFYPKMKKKIIGETQYAWVNYKSLVDDLPILSIEKKQVYRRFSKMCKFGILTHYHDKVGGSFSYYSFGSQYTLLIDSDHGIQKSYPRTQKSYPLGLKSPNKDSSININNSSIKYKEEYKEEKIDCQEVADAFNETCVSLPRVLKLTNKRKKAINSILKKYSLEELKNIFKKVEDSSFLNGSSGKWSGATFDWLIKESNLIKVIEGNYDDKCKYNNLHGTPSYDIEGYDNYINDEDYFNSIHRMI